MLPSVSELETRKLEDAPGASVTLLVTRKPFDTDALGSLRYGEDACLADVPMAVDDKARSCRLNGFPDSDAAHLGLALVARAQRRG